jgi:hypothetical protein
MGVFILICMSICFILGIISSIYLFKMVDVLNEEGISVCSLEFIFSHNKFLEFIVTCNNDKKTKYTKLYKKHICFKRVSILLFVCIFLFIVVMIAFSSVL